MRAVVFQGPGLVTVDNVPDAEILNETDCVVRVTHAGICGSDLWFLRGETDWPSGRRLGHEFVGLVDSVGAEVERFSPGDAVAASFSFSCGNCEFCRLGIYTSCVFGGFFGGLNNGGQAEAVRVPFADTTLLPLAPDGLNDPEVAKAVLLATDVLATGYHAAVCGEVSADDTVVIVGDGAVGLSAVIACRLLNAGRIILVGHHLDRLKLGVHLGASETLSADPADPEASQQLVDMTNGGSPRVLECVGTRSAMRMATDVVRPGGTVGYVGVPHGSEDVDLYRLFRHNITLRGGVAPVRRHMPRLLELIEAGTINPAPIMDAEMSLDDAPLGYEHMLSRRALKVLLRP